MHEYICIGCYAWSARTCEVFIYHLCASLPTYSISDSPHVSRYLQSVLFVLLAICLSLLGEELKDKLSWCEWGVCMHKIGLWGTRKTYSATSPGPIYPSRQRFRKTTLHEFPTKTGVHPSHTIFASCLRRSPRWPHHAARGSFLAGHTTPLAAAPLLATMPSPATLAAAPSPATTLAHGSRGLICLSSN
jgi:hypothetical protein